MNFTSLLALIFFLFFTKFIFSNLKIFENKLVVYNQYVKKLFNANLNLLKFLQISLFLYF